MASSKTMSRAELLSQFWSTALSTAAAVSPGQEEHSTGGAGTLYATMRRSTADVPKSLPREEVHRESQPEHPLHAEAAVAAHWSVAVMELGALICSDDVGGNAAAFSPTA
jgi:hypothetical protein